MPATGNNPLPMLYYFVKKHNLQLENTSFNLSVQLQTDGLSYAILEPQASEVVLMANVPFDQGEILDVRDLCSITSQVIDQEDSLQIDFRSVVVSVVSPKATVIPSAFFNSSDLKQYLDINCQMGEWDELHHYALNNQVTMVFSLPQYIGNLFVQKFGSPTFVHQSTALIPEVLDISNERQKKLFCVCLYNGFMDIVLAECGDLILFNSFSYADENDFVYYIVSFCKKHQINIDDADLYINGDVNYCLQGLTCSGNFLPGFKFLGPSLSLNFPE
ncbi:MAG: DUF3822 family protein [Bacteroidales bacterium]|nr:DUF3822 family protein [Bacteroidales bacterium]